MKLVSLRRIGARHVPQVGIFAVVCLMAMGPAAGAAAPPQGLTPGAPKVRGQAVPGVEVSRVAPVEREYSGIGGAVYATGLGEVTVTVHPVAEFLADGMKPYHTTVHLREGDKERLLGSNYQKRTLRLGRVDRGELRLVARSEGGDGVFESGPGNRNSDGLPHSRVKEVRPGVVEVYFENTMREGTRNDRDEQHWYKDVKLTFTGAVTADSGKVFLLERINDSDPEARRAARQALLATAPDLARQAGVR